MSTLRNLIIGQVLSDIQTWILYQFCAYGKITPQQLKSRYDTVELMEYSIFKSIDNIFDVIEDLIKIDELLGR